MSSPAGILDALKDGSSFLLTAHVGPDGDALGSLLAMSELIDAMDGKSSTCVLADRVPMSYRWAPCADFVMAPNEVDGRFDTAVILDCAAMDRIGDVQKLISRKMKVIVVDHHLVDKPCGNVNWVDPTYAATGEMVVELFDAAGIEMKQDAAVQAYIAIATDTGGFQYPNTNARTHRLVASLIERGVDVAGLSERLFLRMSPAKFALLARTLPQAEVTEDGRVATVAVRMDDIKEVGATPEDMDGLINFPRYIDGVNVAILFKDTPRGHTKISVRARDGFNASEFCGRFGGGGHAGAAGATIEAPLDEAKPIVMKALRETMEVQA